NRKLDKSKLNLKKIPRPLAICYSIQYKEIAEQIKKQIPNLTAFLQVLGCSKPKFPKNTKAILLISDGKFHAISLAYESKLPVYLFSNNNLQKISKEDVSSLEKKQKGAYLKYLHSEKIGILVSTTPGQENLKKALEFAKSHKDKDSYLFIASNINTNEFENFPQIESWINTSCPRMDMNNASIINISQIV
ncbi:MAG: diphthamide synthesis protein, partial [Candidatus Pacearchaeota archaeon]|nr:diphthamide synthesis protein [Candidatus Pacearchaeota archaeon]